jgi:zinc/manganese transport system permease protein
MTAVVNPIAGLAHMWGHPFIRNALVAGTAIAIVAGLIGYYLVLRMQLFTADALSHVAFTGALIALTIGLDLRVGLFAATIGVAVLLGALGPRGRADDVVIGSTFAWVLGIGVLALSLFTTHRSTGNGTAGVSVLFGSIYGLDASATRTAVLIAVAVAAVTLVISRPLLFASVDEDVALARGVPVRFLGYVFLVLVGATAAEAAQAVGSLLLLGLLAAPAGSAIRLTARPGTGILLAPAIAVLGVWGGLVLSYAVPRIPPSFGIIAILTAIYLATFLPARSRGRLSYS